ncbi:MAG TPA: TolC family protein, partial [Chitinophagales bacterium]
TLQKLIDSAIVKNSDMRLALKNIESAKLLVKQAKWNYAPNLNVGINAQTNAPSQSTLNGVSLSTFLGKSHLEDFNLNFGLSWEIDIWGKIANQKRGAQASFLQTEEAQKAMQTQLVSMIAKSYYNLLMLDKQIEIAKKNVLLSDTILNILQVQYQMGQATLLAVQQVQAQRLLATQLIPNFEQQIAVQENALSVLCGQVPDKVSRTITLDEVAISENLTTGIPAQLLSLRPDVKVAELDLKRANFHVGYTHAAMFPSLVINAQGGVESFLAGDWFKIPASLFGIIGGGLTQPLFQHRQLRTNYQIAKIDREKAVIKFRQQMLVAVQEVSDALVKIDKLKAQQSIATERSNLLIDATSNADLLFKNGLATYLEVITAQGNQLNATIDKANIKKSQLEAQIDLYRSLGGGWQ